jgi:hypothetical protein
MPVCDVLDDCDINDGLDDYDVMMEILIPWPHIRNIRGVHDILAPKKTYRCSFSVLNTQKPDPGLK